MTTAVQIALSAFGLLLIGALFAWLPVSRGPAAFFGAPVDPCFMHGEGRRTLSRWRLLVALWSAASLLVLVVTTLLSDAWLLTDLVLTAGLTSLLGGLYVRYAARARRWAVPAEEPTAAALRQRPASLRAEPVVTAVSWIGTLASVSGSAWLWLGGHGITTAFSSQGERVEMLLGPPLLVVYLQVAFCLFRREMSSAAVRLRPDDSESIYALRLAYLESNLRALDAGRVLAGGLGAGLAIALVGAIALASPAVTLIGVVAAVVGTGTGLTLLIRSTLAMLRLQAEITARGGVPLGVGEERCWSWGGSVYRNPNDAAFLVEKRVGLGYTINFAHPKTKYFFSAVAVAPLGVALLFILGRLL